MRKRLMWTQQNRANCCRRCAFFRLATNPTKPNYQLGRPGFGRGRLTNSVEHERDESVVSSERDEVGIDKYNVLEIVDD
jgi:hypothetical protein